MLPWERYLIYVRAISKACIDRDAPPEAVVNHMVELIALVNCYITVST